MTILKFTYHYNLEESFQQRCTTLRSATTSTKAFNKKYFLDRLETEIAYARRHRHAPLPLMFDVDHFKRVNDTLRPPRRRLRARASLVEDREGTLVRTEDVFARTGGEEFAVICRNVPLGSAWLSSRRANPEQPSRRSPFDFEGLRDADSTPSVLEWPAHPDLPVETAVAAHRRRRRGALMRRSAAVAICVLLKHGV